MLNIDYLRGKRQSVIDRASFVLEDDKQLVLSIVDVPEIDDSEKIAGQKVRVGIKDGEFGEDELSVELGVKDGVDLIRILQRLFRQVANFRPGTNGDEG